MAAGSGTSAGFVRGVLQGVEALLERRVAVVRIRPALAQLLLGHAVERSPSLPPFQEPREPLGDRW
jgi:hypothetical protein